MAFNIDTFKKHGHSKYSSSTTEEKKHKLPEEKNTARIRQYCHLKLRYTVDGHTLVMCSGYRCETVIDPTSRIQPPDQPDTTNLCKVCCNKMYGTTIISL